MEIPVVMRNSDPKVLSTSVSKRIVTAGDMVDKEIGSLERSNHLPRPERGQAPLS